MKEIRFTAPKLILFYILFLMPLLMFAAARVISPEVCQAVFMKEDGPVEWLTFVGFLAAGILLLGLLRLRRHMPIPGVLFLLGVGVFSLLCAGEEISWGQRVFGVDTPDFIAEVNEQNEINIHNLSMVKISPKGIMSGLMGAFGILMPLIGLFSNGRFQRILTLYFPPPLLIPCFLMPEAIDWIVKHVFPIATTAMGLGAEHWVRFRTDEVAELYWGISMMLAAIAVRRAWKASRTVRKPAGEQA